MAAPCEGDMAAPHSADHTMTNDRCPPHDEIKQCLDELARAHIPVAEWIEDGMRWLGQRQVSRRGLSRAERNCTRHLAALQDNKDVLRVMEAAYPKFSKAFAEARAGIDMMTLRLQAFLKRIRAHVDVEPDRPVYVVHAPLDDVSMVAETLASLVMEQERDFTFFSMSPDFMDAALLHAELDSIEDGCDELDEFAAAVEAKVLDWRAEATPEQHRLLTECERLVQRLRFVQTSKRQAVAKLRDATVDGLVAAKLKKLTEDMDAASGADASKLN
jgi:hypothetical protein